MRWTVEQDKVLYEYGSLGAEECKRILHKKFNVNRSIGAIKVRASRIGASLFIYSVCPRCGSKAATLMPSGLCRLCHQRELVDNQREANSKLRKELYELENGNAAKEELEIAKSEYFSVKQSNWRLRKRIHGRRSGDFVEV